MPDTAKKAPKIKFFQYHQPSLTVGEYQITVQQAILGSKFDTTSNKPPFETSRSFTVAGERFTLNPQDIHAVFPPDGSLGEHDNVLPHILLNRSTLPWEREVTPISTDKIPIPWMALLLFHETDPPPSPQVLTLKDLKQHPQWSDLLLETGQQETDPVMVIDVPAELLSNILPSQDDLKYLAHVRQADYYQISDRILERFRSDRDILTTKLATLKSQEFNTQNDFLNNLQSKLGKQDADTYSSVILEYAQHSTDTAVSYQITDQILESLKTHLNQIIQQLKSIQEQDFDTDEIFLENLETAIGEPNTKRYHSIILPLSLNRTEPAVIISNRLPQKGGISTAHLVSLEKVNLQKEPLKSEPVRLITLKNWRFSCEYAKQTFKGLLTHLNREPSTLKLPSVSVTDTQAKQYLEMGYVPLPHHLRQGGKTISWYHSPLLPGENPSPDNPNLLPCRAADALLRYNPSNGMFDISYAAAWELGRLLALQSKDFSINLYNWKRTHVQQLKQAEQKLVHPLTPESSSEALEIPKAITDWFKDLSLLKGVPFNYLVPDERMLPSESIRFFWVDPLWIDCLLDGAFSIGRVATSDYQRDRSLVNQEKSNPDHPPLPRNPAANPYNTITGFLMRSDVVSGWPGLLVDASDELLSNDAPIPEDKKLKLLRMERLSPNVLLCLFAGEITTVDIHQKPETLHFGLDRPDGEHADFYKKLRDYQEHEEHESNQKIDSILWKNKNNGTVDIERLVRAIQDKLNETLTSANFAREMIEGVEKVRFTQASH